MPIVKKDYPILEYDNDEVGIIMPNRHAKAEIPEVCVMTFFKDELDAFVAKNQSEVKNDFRCAVRSFPIYVSEFKNTEICLIHAAVGSTLIAMMTDYLISYGVKKIILSGGCGVLKDIPAGRVIIPTVALRDEGASYHYLPPARDVELDSDIVTVIKNTLNEQNVPYITCKTWTTDGFFRETQDMINYRKEEGCEIVEMECATIASVAKRRHSKFGALLYSGDILADFNKYDDRTWKRNYSARSKLFFLSLEIATKLKVC